MGNSMIKIEPVMDADIVPGIQAAGIKLGISFDYFKKSTEHIYKPTKEECDVLSTHNSWFFFHRDEMTIGGIHINEIYCYWDNNIVLEFSGDESILTGIHVMSKYSGYLLKKLKIGDRLDLLKYELGFDFYYGHGDTHYLKPNPLESEDILEGVYITTNYLLPYSAEYPDHIVTAITVYL